MMFKIKSKHRKYIRIGLGVILLILGVVFTLVPFIPLGYIFLVGGLFLLAYEIPALKKILNKIKARDHKGRVEKVEQKMRDGEKVIEDKLVANENESSPHSKSIE